MTPSQPSERARQRGLRVLLADTFLMWGGFFMVVPLVAVHYVDGLGWSAASVGLVLAVRQFVQQGLTPLSGMLADRLGPKGLICTGLLVRAAGFAWMAGAQSFAALLGSAVLAALGGGLFDAPKSAAIAALTEPATRSRFYSLQGVVSGLGITLGTQAGALMISFDFAWVALTAAGCFLVTFLVTWLGLPAVTVAAEGQPLTRGLGRAIRDRRFMAFTVLLAGYWFLWVQFSISLPLVGRAISGSMGVVSWIYGIQSGMSIVLQYPLLRLAERRLRPLTILIIGITLMAVGFGAVGLAQNVPALLACVVCVSAGVLLASPSQQTVTAALADPAALGSYFGVSALALALGGGVGNLGGGLLYDLGVRTALPALPWAVFCAVGLLSSAGLMGLACRGARPAAAAPAATGDAGP